MSSMGGTGGTGGQGGTGGAGAGGRGGSCFGIYLFGASNAVLLGTPTTVLGIPGVGGLGGAPCPTNTFPVATNGQDGVGLVIGS